ncbi:MAG: response regulator, partial [Blastocatellia bacterium]|nr:response regulator [Blastocatellia bacterium]
RTSGQLPPESNKFEFHYAGLSFVAPEKVRYRVQLVGYDPDWLEAGALRVAYYTNLPPRAYRFRVLACNNDGVWNLKGAEVSFSIRPPWYQNLWAKGLFVLFGMAAVVSFIRIRLRTLHQKNQILDTKVRERTTELAATVEQLRQSEATIQEKAGELARTIERLQESEQKAHESEHEALKAKGEAEQANQAKSVFFSNLSHELRTPLNAVIGFAQLLGREPGLNTAQRDTLNIIVRSGEHLLNLINDVLSISKIEAGKLTLNHQPFDLRALVHDLQNMLKVRAQAKGLLLLVSIGPEVPAVVSGDEGKLRQVLLNLMGNAIKFTDVGSVTLRVQGGAGNRVEFEVEDTGQGMETDELERSFQPFEQTASGVRSREGTGLGLFISRNFVKLMGGDVQVSSEVGRGTTFSFEIPLPVVSGVIPPPRETRKVIGLQAGQPAFRLLVVDDKEDNRLLLRRLLEGVGFVVREAVDGVEAISVWKEWQPQLIWMDMRMPVMDGYEATKSIRQLEQAQAARKTVTKIIAFTASVLEHERAGIFQAGCNDIVFKPFWEHTIFEKLTEHLQVEFRYEDQAEPAQPTPATPFSLRQMLGGLSADLTGELYQALLIGNVKLATQMVDRIAEHHPEAGRELHQMVRDCQFDEIMDLLETVSK